MRCQQSRERSTRPADPQGRDLLTLGAVGVVSRNFLFNWSGCYRCELRRRTTIRSRRHNVRLRRRLTASARSGYQRNPGFVSLLPERSGDVRPFLNYQYSSRSVYSYRIAHPGDKQSIASLVAGEKLRLSECIDNMWVMFWAKDQSAAQKLTQQVTNCAVQNVITTPRTQDPYPAFAVRREIMLSLSISPSLVFFPVPSRCDFLVGLRFKRANTLLEPRCLHYDGLVEGISQDRYGKA